MIQSIMILWKFIFLGLVQGMTEPLPISSSGHLVLLRHVFQMETPGLTFEMVVHFGSLIAIIMVYHKDIATLCRESFTYCLTKNNKYRASFHFSWMLGIATIVTGVVGLLVEPFIADALTTPVVVGIAFLITSFFLWLIRHLKGHKSGLDITFPIAILIGLAQACALFPGISRSGATLVAAMLLGLKRETALRFSFLLFIPVSLGINLMSIHDFNEVFKTNPLAIPYLLAFITSIIATYYALKIFIQVMLRGKLIVFSLYCALLGSMILLFHS